MKTKAPPRFNLFNRAHKAIRALLCNTLLQVQKTDFTSPGATGCVAGIRVVLEVLQEHAYLEDHFIFPLLQSNAPSLAAFFEKQHHQDELLTQDVEAALTGFENASGEQEQLLTGIVILEQYAAFVAFNLSHMNMEEQLINPFLWTLYSDAELVQRVTEALQKAPPVHDDLLLRLMIENQNSRELAVWFAAMGPEATEKLNARLSAAGV